MQQRLIGRRTGTGPAYTVSHSYTALRTWTRTSSEEADTPTSRKAPSGEPLLSGYLERSKRPQEGNSAHSQSCSNSASAASKRTKAASPPFTNGSGLEKGFYATDSPVDVGPAFEGADGVEPATFAAWPGQDRRRQASDSATLRLGRVPRRGARAERCGLLKRSCCWDQVATAGRVMSGVSVSSVMVSTVMYRAL